VELKPNAGLGDGRVLGAQIGAHLVDDALVAARLELRIDHMLDISLSGIAEKAETLGCPHSEQPIPANSNLEAQFLVVPEPDLELLRALGKRGHILSPRRPRQSAVVPPYTGLGAIRLGCVNASE